MKVKYIFKLYLWVNITHCRRFGVFGGKNPLILHLGTRWKWVVTFTPQLLYQLNRTDEKSHLWYPVQQPKLEKVPAQIRIRKFIVQYQNSFFTFRRFRVRFLVICWLFIWRCSEPSLHSVIRGLLQISPRTLALEFFLSSFGIIIFTKIQQS
jgi:hypothetical protein